MASLETRAAEIDQTLAAPDAFADPQAAAGLQRERSAIADELAQLENDWLERQAELESIDREHGGD